MRNKMKIIFGGAFNPPTIAHKEIYNYIKSNIKFDSFVYLPVSNKYHKDNLLKNEDRYNMLKIMMKDYNDVTISKDEFKDKKYLGTYHYLKSQKEECFFLIGSDNLRDLKTWINYEKLVSECHFIVISRDNMDDESYIKSDPLLYKNKDNFVLLKGFNMDVSSSEFRRTKDKSLVTKEVYEYIIKHKLYGGSYE